MAMRFVTHGVTGVLALLIGFGIGYLLWQSRSADLSRQLEQQRSDFNSKLAEAEGRTKEAEERARREAETRKVFEEEIERVRPQK